MTEICAPHLLDTWGLRFCPTEKGQVMHSFQMFGLILCRMASAAHSTVTGDGEQMHAHTHTQRHKVSKDRVIILDIFLTFCIFGVHCLESVWHVFHHRKGSPPSQRNAV